MHVAPGEVVAITGASGSGKSTLLHVIAGIIRPDEGEVRFDGRRIDNLPEAELSRLRRTEFGILFQFGQLVAELTAVENVALPLLLAGTSRRVAHDAALDRLGRLGVAELAGARPGEMSGGQAQRVAMGRALITAPKLVFADEPTGALDSLSSEQVLRELLVTARREGAGVVLVTHDAQVAAYADREVVLQDGAVASVDGIVPGRAA